MPKHGVTEFLATFQDVGTTFFDIERDLLIVLDHDGNVERVNPAFEKVLGRTESEVLGQAIIRLVVMEDWAQFMHSFDYITRAATFRLLHRDAGLVNVRLIAYRFKKMDAGQRGFLILRPLDLD
jgi:PAS domain S-box-containing protein